MISDVEIRRVQTRLRVDITIHKGGGFYWRGQLKVCKIIGWLRFKSKKNFKKKLNWDPTIVVRLG